MSPITSPIHKNEVSDNVANLQQALSLLLPTLGFPDFKILQEELQARQALEGTAMGVLLLREKLNLHQPSNPLGLHPELMAPQGEVLVDEILAAKINELMAPYFTVRGRLMLPDGKGLAGHQVTLSEYDLEGAIDIGKTVTNADGAFEFVYDFGKALRHGDGRTQPDLWLQVTAPAGDMPPVEAIFLVGEGVETAVPRLADSALAPIVLMNAAQHVTVRIVLAAAAEPQLTEFERLVAALKPLMLEKHSMREKHFADLLEDETHFQISFLSKESGIPKAKIEALKAAFAEERAVHLPAWAFFGLSQIPFPEARWNDITDDELEAMLKPLKPLSALAEFDSLAKSLQDHALEHLKEQAIREKTDQLFEASGPVLQSIFGIDGHMEAFFQAYAAHNGAIEDFWKDIVKDLRFKEKVPEIQLTLQLSQLTLGNTGLVAALKDKGIRETKELVHLQDQAWIDMIKQHPEGIPAHIPIPTDGSDAEKLDARAATYASELQTMVEIVFPTEVIKARMGSAEFKRFLDNNQDFDFTQKAVEKHLRDAPASAWTGIENREAVIEELRVIQRLYSVTASASDVQLLMNHGFSSSFQIAKHSLQDFVTLTSGSLTMDKAVAFHAKAQQVTEMTGFLYHELQTLAHPFTPKSLGEPAVGKTALPNWPSLFGQVETCECEHCRSVYSPAAYYVDLLHVLLGKDNGKPRHELFRRRPDLKYTLLTCEHTDTLIPYIDLVNEILETYVAQQEIGNGWADTHAKTATNDTSAFTEDELAANPQHPMADSSKDADHAYRLLSEAYYPLNLPFDLNLETARQFLASQGTSRYELMETFGVTAANADAAANAIVAEGLGLSAAEYEIFVGMFPERQADDSIILKNWTVENLFGKGGDLSQVREFLDRTGIHYVDLVALTETTFLNPDREIGLVLNLPPANYSESEKKQWQAANACNLNETAIRYQDGRPIGDPDLLKFNRFIRLWKKLGCSIEELDALLMAVNAGDPPAFTPQLMADLSALRQFAHSRGIPLAEAAILLGNIPTRGENALYSKLFQNKAILQIDPGFAFDAQKNELVDVSSPIEDHLPALMAALQTTEQGLREIAEILDPQNKAKAALNLRSLSAIYRMQLFAKLNRLSLHELYLLRGFLPHLPWANVTEMLETQALIDRLKAADLRAGAIAYLFGGAVEAGNAIAPKAEVIEKFQKDLRAGLTQVGKSLELGDKPIHAQFLKTQLGLVLDEPELDKLIAILDGSNLKKDGLEEDPMDWAPISAQDAATLQQPGFKKEYETAFKAYLSAADVAKISAETTPLGRYDAFWTEIQSELSDLLRTIFVKQHLFAHFQVDAQLVNFVFPSIESLFLSQDAPTPPPLDDAYSALFKFFWLTKKFSLSSAELSHFQTNRGNFEGFDWNDFAPQQIHSWLRLAVYCQLRDALPKSNHSLIAVFETANKGADPTQAIVDATGYDQENVAYFVGRPFAVDFTNETALVLLQTQIRLSQIVGVSIQKLEDWSTGKVEDKNAQDIKRSLKAKYEEESWVSVSTQVHNRLRNVQRDALAGYLLQSAAIKALNVTLRAQSRPEILNANGLYAYFLIDVEMDAVMKTSRLKQAIASVQLFTQRCIMNLEPTISPTDIDQQQWSWMKYYRVWEANRKVFLYPENWIEPELRDGKSPFFKELESELLQGEVTPESVEKAIQNYLYKLDDVARLDICGMYEDPEGGKGGELHVFGRTFNNPPIYYYRKLDLDTHEWTAWEKVQLDIQGNDEGPNPGVHLIPVVWNRRLYLFWPVFREMVDRERQTHSAADFQQKHAAWQKEHDEWKKTIADWDKTLQKWRDERQKASDHWFIPSDQVRNYPGGVYVPIMPGFSGLHHLVPEPQKPAEKREPLANDYEWPYWEIRMAWSEYGQSHWGSKRIGTSALSTKGLASILGEFGKGDMESYRFELGFEGSGIAIESLFCYGGINYNFGAFRFSGHKDHLSIEHRGITTIESNNNRYTEGNIFQGFGSTSTSPWKFDLNLDGNILNLFGKNLSPYKVLLSNLVEQNIRPEELDSKQVSKLFYQDGFRNYYAAPRGDLYSKALQGLQKRDSIIIEPYKGKERDVKVIAKPKPEDKRSMMMDLSELDGLVTKQSLGSVKSMALKSGNPPENIYHQLPARPKRKQTGIYEQYLDRPTPANTITKLEFHPFFHRYVVDFIKALHKDGVPGLLTLENQRKHDWFRRTVVPLEFTNLFEATYHPNERNIWKPFPSEDIDFSLSGAYSLYNWELFFHIPMLLANRLSHNQKFEDAMRWYHFIFDPTTHDPSTEARRYWQVVPLRNTPKETLEALMLQLNNPQGDPKRRELEEAITRWRSNPFNPHLIARLRLVAYQKNVVMKYLDNLLAWADNLFRQDTIENINQATQLYIIAAELLGPRPEKVPARGKIEAKSYHDLEEAGLNAFSNALVQMETTFPFFNLQTVQSNGTGSTTVLSTTVPAEYFGLPDNPKLLGYWDTVADRLFKIRHSLNIEGVERTLALYEPPIDPALLVQAVAKGIDISSVLADLNAPLPYYRFNYIVQKALEICGELKSLGNSLLSALEKKDNETLSLMRTQHETTVLGLMKAVKQLQIKEAQRSREGLEKTMEVTEHRFEYYKGLLETGLNASEREQQDNLEQAHKEEVTAHEISMHASLLHSLPNFSTTLKAIPETSISFGGSNLGSGLQAVAEAFRMFSSGWAYYANLAQINSGHERRAEEWTQQQELAQKELLQIQKQIDAAMLREQIADKDLSNHEQQIDNARQVEDYLRNKYTQEELYGWMIGEISTVYFQCYQLVYDLAKKAEKTYRHELGIETSNFVQFGVWDSFRKGLLSGERLYLSLKQMEKAYMDQNRREYELTKHVSLALLDPLSLVRLRTTGTCDFEIPEALYDMDHPGQYFRRLKSVSLSIPCIVGPYTSVSAKLTLIKSRYRYKADGTANYPENPDSHNDDPRFKYTLGAIQSIATSHGQNDSGMFELNFRDERYLPFEYAGAISTWRLELPDPKVMPQFDYDTISDVLLHVKYTAREGGNVLKKAANDSLTAQLNVIQQSLKHKGLHHVIDLKHDMSNEWFMLRKDGKQDLTIDKARLPYFMKGLAKLEVVSVMFIAKATVALPTFTIPISIAGVAHNVILRPKTELGGWLGGTTTQEISGGDLPLSLAFASANYKELENLTLVLQYKGTNHNP